jgi:Zinc finger, C3HC4 type (RING finger)
MQPSTPAPGQHQYYDPNGQAGSNAVAAANQAAVMAMSQPPSSQAAAAPGVMGGANQQQHMSKTDSHAVLMELFARDQDLVRQATESAAVNRSGGDGQQTPNQYGQNQGQTSTQIGGAATTQGESPPSQHPMKTATSNNRLSSVPTLNSWPHFSSVSSLNNLGTMPGVKSITSLSAADLAKQGPVNTVGNLAQVKSVESMGKNDSYAFLEVFFGDRSSNNLNGMMGKDQRGMKREREEDNEIGLSLEDEGPSSSTPSGHASTTHVGSSASLDNSNNSSTLKRAYDDAIAAQGLLHISRSSEKLTDLALPAKMQKTLSQEFARQHQQQQQQQRHLQPTPQQYSVGAPSLSGSNSADCNKSHQYPAQPTAQSGQATSTAVQVPPQTKCAICGQTVVDTQLRPCGHMFHERCLKPLLEKNMPPKCPIDAVPIESALLAIPMENSAIQPQPFQMHDNRRTATETQSEHQ